MLSLSYLNSEMEGRPAFNKANFINNVCSCLDSCSAYIQSLNALCASGTVLAHNLLAVFRDLPPYREAAEQFVSTWEELSKATAGASSGVKTETLMTLQEVITSLEEQENNNCAQSINAVGSCLLSYVQLQSSFSLACSTSLSSVEPLLSFSFFSSDDEKKTIHRTTQLIESIRKYYSFLNPGQSSSRFSNRRSITLNANNQATPQASPVDSLPNELEEVLNLLSCQPDMTSSYLEWASSNNSANTNSEISTNHPKSSPQQGKRTWPRCGPTSYGWGNPMEHHNWQQHHKENQKEPWTEQWSCSSDGSSSQTNEVFLGFQDIISTQRQRRHSSTDGMPDAEAVLDIPFPWEAHQPNRMTKTSTWPLKQQSEIPHHHHLEENPHSRAPSGAPASLGPLWNDSTNSSEKKYTLFGQIT